MSNPFSLFTILIYGLIFYKLFNSRIFFILVIQCLGILNLYATVLFEVVLLLMTITLLIIEFKKCKYSKLLILSCILQFIMLLNMLINSVSLWDYTDDLAMNTLQILNIFLLLALTSLFIRFRHPIDIILSAFSTKENLFLLLPSFISITFMIQSNICFTNLLDLYWSIIACSTWLLWFFLCFYLFYVIEIHLPKIMNRHYEVIVKNAHEEEINELRKMKQEIARTYHELDNVKLLNQFYNDRSYSIDAEIKTGYSILDYILNEETKRLKDEGFQLKLEISLSYYPFNESETISLFKNIFDNIIQHASKDESILLKIIEVKQSLIIICNNKIKHLYQNPNNWKHGHGLSIIKEIISHYNGYIESTINSHYFLKIIVPQLIPTNINSSLKD